MATNQTYNVIYIFFFWEILVKFFFKSMKHTSANLSQTYLLIKEILLGDSKVTWGIYISHCSLKEQIWSNQSMLKGNSSNLFTDLCMSSPTVTKRHGRGWKSSKYRTGSRGLQDFWRATGLCLHWKSEEVASKISAGMDHNRTDKQCQREWRQARRKEIFSSSIAFKIILILIFETKV